MRRSVAGLRPICCFQYDRPVSVHLFIEAWRLSRSLSVPELAAKAGLSPETVEAIEAGALDPAISVVDSLAKALAVPTPWLFDDPKHLELCLPDSGDDAADSLPTGSSDPVTKQMLVAAHHERTLYVLLTSLIQHGDPKLLRAAEVSLRSLVKQCRHAAVPWQERPPGHFEPPSD
jgi:DNA-binding XRE family transcriptional regulator